jgi:hypothetical protein
MTSEEAATLLAPSDTPDTSTSAKKADAAAGFFCYIGPSVPSLIQHGTIYTGTREQALAAASAAIEKHPVVKTLIVSGESLPEARLRVKKPGNTLYQNYQRVLGKG